MKNYYSGEMTPAMIDDSPLHIWSVITANVSFAVDVRAVCEKVQGIGVIGAK